MSRLSFDGEDTPFAHSCIHDLREEFLAAGYDTERVDRELSDSLVRLHRWRLTNVYALLIERSVSRALHDAVSGQRDE